MTGNEIYKQACMLLECDAEQTESGRELGLVCLNSILCDLKVCEGVKSLDEQIVISPTNGFIAAFGVAMLIAQTRLDTVRRYPLEEVYKMKRLQARAEITRRGETFPKTTA